MEFIWVLVAFICGFVFRAVSLPPLIGFLCAGFLLNFWGVEQSPSLQVLADLGITLMLFTIGLKLNIRDLLKPEVWVGAGGAAVLWTTLFTVLSIGLLTAGVAFFAELTLETAALLAFGLSFSSTVCIVKVFEDSGEMKTRHGKLSIAVLVMQDIFAVVFLVIATGKVPSMWALALPLLLVLKPVFDGLLQKAGHGELLPLTGFFLALGGYELFDLVSVKGDLGALIMGILLSSHVKSSELAKSLLGFKDLFLIGFFLSIGFIAIPTLPMLGMALVLCLLLPIKFILFFALFTRLKLRGRTSYLAGLALSNFSEFGLIVVALSVEQNWLAKDWLVILAIAASLSFIFTSVAYRYVHRYYKTLKPIIMRWERQERLVEDAYVQPGNAEILVVGLGRVGKSSLEALCHASEDNVWGLDADHRRVMQLRAKGKQVICGDAEDTDLWERINLSNTKLILLALPSIEDVDNICRQLKEAGYMGQIAAMARFEDELEGLKKAGVDKVFNFYTEVGAGFADESLRIIA